MMRRVAVALAIVAVLAGAVVVLRRAPGDARPPASAPSIGTAPASPDRVHAPPRARADAPDDAAPAPPEARTLTVRVLARKDERPIAGARVTVLIPGDGGSLVPKSYATDDEGRVSVALPERPDGFIVEALARHHVRGRHDAFADNLPEEIVFRLDPAGSVRGLVRFADGAAAPGTWVWTTFEDSDAIEPAPIKITADGAYEIDGIPVGTTFVVHARGRREDDDWHLAVRRGLTVPSPDRPIDADLLLLAPASLTVRVLWDDGEPILGALVRLEPGPPAERMSTQGGWAEFGEVPPERGTVVVCAWGFAEARAEVDLRAGERQSIAVHPVPGPLVQGVVVDEAGFPVANAEVEASSTLGGTARVDGSFRIACPDRSPRVLIVRARGFARAELAGVEPPADGLRIVLRRMTRVHCRLIRPTGVDPSKHVAAWADSRVVDATVDDDELTIDLPPGAKRVSFAVPGCVTVARAVDPSRAPVDDWGDIQLVAAPLLAGRVVDGEGKAVHAFVYPKVGDVTVPLGSTDADGAFSFDGLPPGNAEVRVEAEGFVTRTMRHGLAAGSAPLTIVLARGGGVRGVVLDASGKPAPKAVYVSFVDLSAPEDRDRMAWPSIEDNGRFEVRLAPGRYRALTSLDTDEADAEVEVAEGETRELTLRLAPR